MVLGRVGARDGGMIGRSDIDAGVSVVTFAILESAPLAAEVGQLGTLIRIRKAAPAEET